MRKFTFEWLECILKASFYVIIIGILFTIFNSWSLYGRLIPVTNHQKLFIAAYFCTSVFVGFALLWSVFNEVIYQRHLEEDGTSREKFKSGMFKSVIKMYPLYLLGLMVISYFFLIIGSLIVHIVLKIPFEVMKPEIRNRIYEIGYVLGFLIAINTKIFPPLKN